MLFTFGTLRINGRTYSENDLKRLVPLSRYAEHGVDDSWYGGRVTHIGETDSDVLLLIQNKDGLNIIDTASTSLNNVNITLIRALCDKRKLKYDRKLTTKEDMIRMLGGDPVERETYDARRQDDVR